MPGSGSKTGTKILAVLKPRRKHLRKYSWLPDVLRVKGSVVRQIFGPVLTVTIFAALVAYAWSRGISVVLTNSVVPLLSVVVGLILVFRNGTSYDRYWEGRKSFSTLTSNVRNLSRMVWVNVGVPPTDEAPSTVKGKTPVTSVTATQLRRRKVEVLKLSLSFAYAVKHYLRGEDGTHYADYNGVLPKSFPRYDEQGFAVDRTSSPTSYAATNDNSRAPSIMNQSLTTDGEGRENRPDATKRIRVKRSKKDLTASQNLKDSQFSPLLSAHRTVDFLPVLDEVTLPLPLIISHHISTIIYHFRRDGFLETVGPAGLNAMNQTVQSMVDQMTAMERIANTPIPSAYGIHLKQCVTLYLFALPFTLINDLGWSMIPVVTVVAFTLMGIEGIADQIEMPFGNDPSDLPLDRYCEDLKEEVSYIIQKLPEGGQGRHGYDDGEEDD